MKKVTLLSLVLVSLLILSLLGCSGCNNNTTPPQNNQKPVYTLQYAFTSPDNSSSMVIAQYIKEQIEQKTDGKIKIEIYPNAQLGNSIELIEGVQTGKIAMTVQTTFAHAEIIPEAAVFYLPSVLQDMNVSEKALSGKFRDTIAEYYEKAGFKILTMNPAGYYDMSSKKPIKKLEDFAGVTIRTFDNPYIMTFWKSLGAKPTPMTLSQVDSALQQGVVSAVDSANFYLIALDLHKHQKYLINTHHISYVESILINKSIYDELPEEYKVILEEVMKKAEALCI